MPCVFEDRTMAAHAEIATHEIVTQRTQSRRREHLFYTGMSVAFVITVFAGFSRTYFLRSHFDTRPLIPLLHLHGLVFTSWLGLFLTQTTLGRTPDSHSSPVRNSRRRDCNADGDHRHDHGHHQSQDYRCPSGFTFSTRVSNYPAGRHVGIRDDCCDCLLLPPPT